MSGTDSTDRCPVPNHIVNENKYLNVYLFKHQGRFRSYSSMSTKVFRGLCYSQTKETAKGVSTGPKGQSFRQTVSMGEFCTQLGFRKLHREPGVQVDPSRMGITTS